MKRTIVKEQFVLWLDKYADLFLLYPNPATGGLRRDLRSGHVGSCVCVCVPSQCKTC